MTRVVRKIMKFIAAALLGAAATAVFISAAIVMGDHGMSFLSRISVMCAILFGQALIQLAIDL